MRCTQILVLLAAMLIAETAAAENYQVIAHPSVPVSSMPAKDLSPLFLKKVTTWQKWGNALKVVPFDLTAETAARATFSKDVHGKAVSAIKSYWQQQIFSGRGIPPMEVASDTEMMAAVARTPGGVGYVNSETPLSGGVKRLTLTH